MLKYYPLCQHYARFLIVPIYYANNYAGIFDVDLNFGKHSLIMLTYCNVPK